MKRWFTASTPLAPLVAAIALTATGCGGDGDPRAPVYGTDLVTSPNEAQDGRVAKGHYPLDPGWSWTYYRTFELLDPADGSVQESVTDTIHVETMGEVALAGGPAFGLATHGLEIYNGQVDEYTTEVYYLQDRYALTEIAYRGFGALATPAPGVRTEGGAAYRVGDRTFGSVRELARALAVVGPSEGWIQGEPAGRIAAGPALEEPIIYRDDPRVALAYPLRPGAMWVSFTDPWTQTRTVEERGSVRVPAGNFGAARITTDVGIDPNVTWSDWVAAQGLVSREIGGIVEVTTPFTPDVTDTVLMVDRTVLLDFSRPHGGN